MRVKSTENRKELRAPKRHRITLRREDLSPISKCPAKKRQNE
jgi:hypothetical protein